MLLPYLQNAHKGIVAKPVVVWDYSAKPVSTVQNYSCLMLWQSYSTYELPRAVSIPQHIESNAKSLRQRYLEWIYEIGETTVNGNRLLEYFALSPLVNTWWMSLITEKCNAFKSRHITDAIRLLAFAELITSESSNCLILYTSNPRLTECFRAWCHTNNVMFLYRRKREKASPLPLRSRIYAHLPHVLQAPLWLARRFYSRRHLIGAGRLSWKQTLAQVTFVSYLTNQKSFLSHSAFQSTYWGPLPKKLMDSGVSTNWLHHYVPDSAFLKAHDAANLIKVLNTSSNGLQTHTTLDSFLSFSIIFQVLIIWFRLWTRFIRIPVEENIPHINGLMLWPLFRDDWNKSVYGYESISNILNSILYATALGEIPRQRHCLYLLENQPWESGLVQVYKSLHHDSIIGFAHSTIRFWDLRYFSDSRHFLDEPCKMPTPDVVAVCGPYAFEQLSSSGFPSKKLAKVEALRYLYLNSVNTHEKNSSKKLRLLVLCDYSPLITARQLNLLVELSDFLSDIELTVKPHPLCNINTECYPMLNLNVTCEPLPHLLSKTDVVYASALTSAAVDSFCYGVKTITYMDPTSLNLSPLRGIPGASAFVCTPSTLLHELIYTDSVRLYNNSANTYFYLDQSLAMWSSLLNSSNSLPTAT